MEAWMEGLGTLVLDTVDVRISGFSFSPFLLLLSLLALLHFSVAQFQTDSLSLTLPR